MTVKETLGEIYSIAGNIEVGVDRPMESAREIRRLIDVLRAQTGGKIFVPQTLVTARLSFTPAHTGDGYSWGQNAIVTFGHARSDGSQQNTSINFGRESALAQAVVEHIEGQSIEEAL